MVREYEAFQKKMVIIGDFFVLIGSFIIAYFLRKNIYAFYKLDIFPSRVVMGTIYPLDKYLWLLLIILPVWIGLMDFYGAYDSFRMRRFADTGWIILKTGVFGTLIVATLIFVTKLTYISRIFMFLFLGVSLVLLSLEKMLITQGLKHSHLTEEGFRRILVVGTGKRAEKFLRMIKEHPEWGIKVVALVDKEPEKLGKRIMGSEVIGTLEDIPDILHNVVVDEVVFVVPRLWLSHIEESALACEREGVKVSVAVDLFNFSIGRLRATDLGGIPLMRLETTLVEPWQLFLKRCYDIGISLTALCFLWPVMLATALVIKLTSPGPVFYRQVRIGMFGRKFKLLKFRSMIVGADKLKEKFLHLNEMDGPVFKITNDPRLTKVGKFLRRTSLDELPQLINVLRGDMSLVGPRPPLPEEVENYAPWQRRRLSMRPGITCLWQVYGRNKISFERWMKLDLEYIDSWSLGLDFKILLKTVPAVLSGAGAR